MKIYDSLSNEKNLFLKVTDVLLPEHQKEKILLYDIDTTAFEPANGCIFLIGTVYFDGNELRIKQFFSENISDEPFIIQEFLEFSKCFEVLLNYKGDSFDIPFLTGRLSNLRSFYKNAPDTSYIRQISMDLFDEIRPLKSALQLTSTKLDNLRKLTGQIYTERITAENISSFYVQHISKTRLKDLKAIILSKENHELIKDYNPRPVFDDLAHLNTDNDDSFLTDVLNRNRDNIEAVLYIGRLSHLFNMRKNMYTVSVESVLSDESQNGKKPGSVSIKINLNTNNNADGSLNIILPVHTVSLKQFFINYRDYYYFPAQDMAMHKSVAEFADKSSRQKATIRTAYTNVSGEFVKIPSSYIKAQNKKEGCLYKENFETERYYLPVKNILNLNNESLKELSYYCVLDEYKNHLKDILIL